MPRLLDTDFDPPDAASPLLPYRIPPAFGEIVRSWPVGCPVIPREGVHIVPLGDGLYRYRDEAMATRGLLVPAASPAVEPPALPPVTTLAETIELGRRMLARVGQLLPSSPPTVPVPAPAPARDYDYLTVEEAAERARFAVGTLYNAISAGTLKKVKGSYQVRITPAELDRWLTTKRPTRREVEAAKQKKGKKQKGRKKSNGR